MFDDNCLWRENDVSYEFTLQIIVLARMPTQVNYSSQIQFAISFGSSCSVYGSAKTTSVCFPGWHQQLKATTSVQRRRNTASSCFEFLGSKQRYVQPSLWQRRCTCSTLQLRVEYSVGHLGGKLS